MTICPYFPLCSGCTTQNLPYQVQLQKKKESLAQLLRKYPSVEINVFSALEWSYRNRMEFIFHPHGLGLRAKDKATKIMDIENCPITLPKINQLLAEVRTNFFGVNNFNLNLKRGIFRGVVLRSTLLGDSAISFVLSEDVSEREVGGEKEQAIKKIKEFASKTTAKNVLITIVPSDIDDFYSAKYVVVKGRDYLEEELSQKKLHFPIQGFFQNNPYLAEKMLSYVHELLQKYTTKSAELLDLYSGVGNFGIICSELFSKTTFVESFPDSITFAQKNIQLNEIKNASAHVLQAHQLSRLKFSSDLYIIADPPRIGMEEKTIIQLNTLKPPVIIYVSCNPQQLSKDLVKFKNYNLKSVALFDLFPHTWHSEVIVELERKKSD